MSAVSSFESEPLLRLTALNKFTKLSSTNCSAGAVGSFSNKLLSQTSRAVLAARTTAKAPLGTSLTLALFLLVSASALKGLYSGAWLALYWAARFCISSPLVRFDRSVFDVLAFPVPFRNHACRKRRQTRAGARCCLVG